MVSPKRRVLVTGGPTAVGLDPMRVITNRSTGEMARLIAAGFAKKGDTVTLLEGQQTTSRIPIPGNVKVRPFFYFDDLARLLDHELKMSWDVVIHAAAVSDFEPARTAVNKISSHKAFTLRLVPTKKLINSIRRSAPHAILVGFKLETRLTPAFIRARVHDLFETAGCDLVLANSLTNARYKACLLEPCGRISLPVNSKTGIVKALLAWVDKHTS